MKAKRRINNLLDDLDCRLDAIRQMKFKNLQPFDALKSWPVGEERILSGSICRKTKESNNRIYFEVEIPPGVYFSSHWHDCQESIKVIEGELSDLSRPGVILCKGESLFYSTYSPHQPGNAGKSTLKLEVEFIHN